MKNPNSDIFLYAKNHYVTNVMMDDLRVIIGKRNGIAPDMVVEMNIVRIVLGVTLPFLRQMSDGSLMQFLCNLSPGDEWPYEYKAKTPTPTFDEILVSRCLSVLALAAVRDDKGNELIPLDPADPLLLPHKYNGTKGDAIEVGQPSLGQLQP
jgi:hypothetical protein